ncbi:hypothetical protein FSB78_15910 [Sphingomonas ginsenosidivorax]|uniref:DUF11 domain-containing protein n=1 Tax=Sphingomonas ginsenosidivorax TaxID=862135 RepID=A0A5C6UJN6_9SPHN|nr:hypothetical protein [Sphingomonas ginsenosidivorax]TXC72265.1 hypothetical protein FSB78_15910 [Sphingomonas ginsenosidivorax]
MDMIGNAVRSIVVLCMATCLSVGARAQTRAGTPIVNTAGLTYETGGETRALQSNTVTMLVAERLDVRLVRESDGPVALDGTVAAIPFILTNADNGREAFVVTASLATGGRTPLLAIDSDGDGQYDATRDAEVVEGTTPVLEPGATLRLFALVADGSASDALVVTARATTGSGTAGRAFDGQGDGGGDAVVGPTGAAASVTVPLRTAGADPVLVKTQSVADAAGGARRGSVITYTLEARFPGGARDAVIADRIPAGTTFVPGSLRVDNAVLTDAADADSGRFDGEGVAVALGDVGAASIHVVEFKTQIQ